MGVSRYSLNLDFYVLPRIVEILPLSDRTSVRHTPSLDLPQRLERKLARYDASESAFKRWLLWIFGGRMNVY
jgi:hypothetical protein